MNIASIHLQEMVTEFERLRNELQALEKRFYSQLGQGTAPQFSITGQVKLFLECRAGESVTVREIMKGLPEGTSVKSVRTLVHRLAKSSAGKIVADTRGKYRFVTA